VVTMVKCHAKGPDDATMTNSMLPETVVLILTSENASLQVFCKIEIEIQNKTK
jgi:hypothetical protein